MTTENIQLIKLTAADGMVLTDGTSYGKEVYLGANDSAERWSEISESEVPITKAEETIREQYPDT